ncbi:MAG TPA: hypothetical protein VKO20_02390 [Desulfosalsimonadaceae bacterium]|nr:hypothetical protein [Desulfosalsimonadaceae bacterium]
MQLVINLVKVLALLAAAGIIGNWFLREVKNAKHAGKPWYAPYLTIPGGLVLAAVLLPILVWIVQ